MKALVTLCRLAGVILVGAAGSMLFAPDGSSRPPGPGYELVIHRGRVIDPETGLDAIRDVGLTGGRIAAISTRPLTGAVTIDAAGLVVSPGFIDMHSHATETPSMRMQALDGVTTALELELGSLPISAAYARAERQGRPINYGYSVSWAQARMKVLDGVVPDGDTATYNRNFGRPKWTQIASAAESTAVLNEVEQGLRDGGLGIGIMVGYAPASNRREYRDLAALAARYNVPTFTHIRYANHLEPGSVYEGFAEVIAAAVATGAHMHICHINSSSWRDIRESTALIRSATRSGAHITTEAYPYGSGSTTIGAPRYAPENLPLSGIQASDIYLVDDSRWIRDFADLAQVRAERPQALGVFRFLNESKPEDEAVLAEALLFPDGAIASDAIPYTVGGRPVVGDTWPIPEKADAHPRIAGTFSRVMGHWVRERHALTLTDAIRRASLIPAQILEKAAPAMKKKGRLQVGADADIVIFDAATISDRATYENPRTPSSGVRHVIVGGRPVVRDGVLLTDAMPGRPVRGERRLN